MVNITDGIEVTPFHANVDETFLVEIMPDNGVAWQVWVATSSTSLVLGK